MNKIIKGLGVAIFCFFQASQGGVNEELLAAAQEGSLLKVQLLLQEKADVGAKEKDGWTPLHYAALEGKTEVTKLLLQNKADVETKDVEGWTPLHYAALEGKIDVVALLLQEKADVGAKDKDGWTPLHYTALEGKIKVIKLLLQEKADVLAKTQQGKTPLHLATGWGHKKVAELLANQADFGAKTDGRITPLHLAANFGREDAIDLPLQQRADTLAKDEMGYVETAKLLKSEQRQGCRSSQGQNVLPDMSCTRRWTKGVDSLRRLSVEFFKKSTVDYLDQKEEADRSYQRMAEAIKKLMLNITQQPMSLHKVEQSYFNALKLLVTFSNRIGGAAEQKLFALTKTFVEQHDAGFLLRTRYARLYSSVVANLKGFEWMFCFADDDWLGGEEYPYATSKDNKKIGWSPAAEIYCLRLYIDEGLVEESWPTQPEAD